jgi:dTMP kinase
MTGRFVVLEGGDGTGKSTQMSRLVSRLRRLDVAVRETFEPGATGAGAVIRELLLHSGEAISPLAEALLMAADRAQHLCEEVVPSLERGEWVVCDRYVPSSLVYQGVVRGVGVDTVELLNGVATSGLVPDLVVILDVADTTARERVSARPDRLEAEGDAFQASVRDAYRRLAGARGWEIVDGTGAVEVVAGRVWALVEPLLAG